MYSSLAQKAAQDRETKTQKENPEVPTSIFQDVTVSQKWGQRLFSTSFHFTRAKELEEGMGVLNLLKTVNLAGGK